MHSVSLSLNDPTHSSITVSHTHTHTQHGHRLVPPLSNASDLHHRPLRPVRWTVFLCFLFQGGGGGRGLSVLSVLCEALRSESCVLGSRLRNLLVQQHPGSDGRQGRHLQGGGPLPADGGHPGRTSGPGHRERAAERQRAVLLQGRRRRDLQRQEGDHEPESGESAGDVSSSDGEDRWSHGPAPLHSELENSALGSAGPSEDKLHAAAPRHRCGGLSPVSLSSDECRWSLSLSHHLVGLGFSFPLSGLQTWNFQQIIHQRLLVL